MNVEYIETIVVSIIVAFQIVLFLRTRRQIRIFRNIIPQASAVKVSRKLVPLGWNETNSPEQLLDPSSQINAIQENVGTASQRMGQATIIECEENKNDVFTKILYSVNTYLIRNRNSTSDFNLIKDITERNTNAVEEDINLTISIPLYLGLMGTMLGIIVGLFSMSNLSTMLAGNVGGAVDPLGQGISVLLGGVKIAMIASFFGLLLTTVNSGWFFKGSKSLVENRKNDFYTFIQTELLPVINQSLGATFESFQRNLFKFNVEFEENLGKLFGTFDKNLEALELQRNILADIQNLDISSIAKHNMDVMDKLQGTMSEFEKFNVHFSNVNYYVDNSAKIINGINDLLARTDNFKDIADNLENKLSQSQQLLNFLGGHFEDLENYRQKTNESMATTGFSISETFGQLKDHIEKSSQAFKTFTVEEIDLFKAALSDSQTTLQKTIESNETSLTNLQFLKNINDDVGLFKDSTAIQGEKIQQLLRELNKNLERSNIVLNNIEHNNISLAQRRKGIKGYLKKIWGSDDENGTS